MIMQWKNALSYLGVSTQEVISWEEITKDNYCLINNQKYRIAQKGALH